MKTLLKYELKKIFGNKLVPVMICVCVVLSFALVISGYTSEKKIGHYKDDVYNKTVDNYTVNAETVKKMERELERMEADDSNYVFEKDWHYMEKYYVGRFKDGMSEEDAALFKKYPATRINKKAEPKYAALYNAVNKYHENTELVEAGKAAEKELKTNKDLSLSDKEELNYAVKCGKSIEKQIDGYTAGYAFGWENYCEVFDGELFVFLIFTAIAVGVYGVFSNEKATNIEPLIISSKNGRMKTFKIKLTAVLIYTLIVISSCIITASLASFLISGPRGATVSCLSLEDGTYALSMWQLCLLKTALVTAAALMAGLTVAAFSAVINNPPTVLFVSAVTLIAPFPMLVKIYNGGASVLTKEFVHLMPLSIPLLNTLSPTELFYLGFWCDLKLIVPVSLIITAGTAIYVSYYFTQKKKCEV